MKNDILLKAMLLIVMLPAVVPRQTLIGQTVAQRSPDQGITFIAHRGGIVPGYPENTVAAFQNAIDQGVKVIEIDLRNTKDGKIVILHDETLERTTNGSGKVVDHTLDEIKRLDAGYGASVPTYEEVLQLIADMDVALLLDIKESPTLDKVEIVRLTEVYRAVNKVIVGARSLEDIKAFRLLNPQLRMLGFISAVTDIEPFIKADVDIIRLWPSWITENPALIKKVQNLGKPVWVTAGDMRRNELEKLVKLGVNGMLIDDLAMMRIQNSETKKKNGQ